MERGASSSALRQPLFLAAVVRSAKVWSRDLDMQTRHFFGY